MGPMGRRLDRLFTEVGDLADVSKRVAVNQAEQGRRRCSDFEYVGADGLTATGWRCLVGTGCG